MIKHEKPKVFHQRKPRVPTTTRPATGAPKIFRINGGKWSLISTAPVGRKQSLVVKKAEPTKSLPAFWFKQPNDEIWEKFRQTRPVPHRKYSKHLYSFIDGVYGSYWVGRFMRLFIKEGKAATSERYFYNAFRELYLIDKVSGNEAVAQAMETIKPVFAIKRKRFGKRKMKYYPIILPPTRQFELALHSLKDEINKYWRQETEFDIRIIDILKNRAEYLKRDYEKRRKRTLFGEGGAIKHRHNARWSWRTRIK